MWWVVDEVDQTSEYAFGARILNPTLLSYPVDALSVRKPGRFVKRRLKMTQIVCQQSASQSSTG
jgi:hypothetical protein